MKVKKFIALLIIIALGSTGGYLTLLSTSKHGAGFSPDSIQYLGIARSLLAGQGYRLYDSRPNIYWPPLLPSVMALVSTTGLDPAASPRYINAVAFGVTIIISGCWLLRYTRSVVLAVAGSIGVLCSWPLLVVSRWVWSESLFALGALLFLYTITNFLNTPTLKNLFISSIIMGITWLDRYNGITLFLSGVIIILLNRYIPFKKRIFSSLIFAGVSGLPLTVWLIRNWLITNSIGGQHFVHPATTKWFGNISTAGKTILMWFYPGKMDWATPWFCFFVAIGILVIYLLLFLIQWYRMALSRQVLLCLLSLICFVTIYTGFHVVYGSTIAIDPLDDRLLSPLYVPLLLFFLFTIRNILYSGQSTSRRPKLTIYMKRFAAVVLAIVAVAWTRAAYSRVLVHANYWAHHGGGYNNPVFRDSPTVNYLRSHELGGVVYSNIAEIIYLHTGQHVTRNPIRTHWHSTEEIPGQLEIFRRVVAGSDEAYMIWYGPPEPDNWFYSLKQLSQVCRLEVVSELSDGTIYSIKVNPVDLNLN